LKLLEAEREIGGIQMSTFDFVTKLVGDGDECRESGLVGDRRGRLKQIVVGEGLLQLAMRKSLEQGVNGSDDRLVKLGRGRSDRELREEASNVINEFRDRRENGLRSR